MNKQDGLKQITRLVEKYENLSPAQRRNYNESMTCKDFILPLFQALSWDVYNKFTDYEVTSETQVSGKRVDYAFHIDNTTKFFLEAKKIDIDLREERWAEQTIMYAWHKSVPWAILTDFESLKVFNAEWDEPDTERSIIFEIPYKNYLTDEKLWWLSKQAIEAGDLDRYAEENFKKPKREPVDKQLAADLVRWRKTLFDNLKGWNSDKLLTDKQLAEAVQRILDRLIFIRTTEDKSIENRHLQELERNYRERSGFDLIEELKKLFKNYDGWYNSKLFQSHGCDILEYENSFLADIIKELYKNKKGIRYDFASINADVLGSIYEQYLGQIQREDGEQKKSSKRKSQGIYYTPRYIVDYIVQNTLGEILKGKPAHEASKIKVLDPACGSGSFLIKAFEVLDEHIKREKNQKGVNPEINYARKFSVLTSNIYGVDLDPEAVEISQLNLLLKTLERRERLPNLTHNIECGNSLISGTEQELKKYFGKDWKNKKPFNWGEEFSDVFKQGGFDVVIGNPPYIQSRNLNDEERKFYWEKYLTDTNHSDIYSFFIEKSIDLLKNKGFLGFIIPDTWLQTPSFKSLREKIFSECKILSVLIFEEGLRVFEGAQVSNLVLILQKESNKEVVKQNSIKIVKKILQEDFAVFNTIRQCEIETEKGFNTSINLKAKNIFNKIFTKSIDLNSISKIIGGLRTGDDNKFLKINSENKDNKKLLRGRNIGHYYSKWDGEYVWYRPDLMKIKQAAAPKESKFFEAKEKLLVRMISGNTIISTYDNEGFYLLQDNLILPGDEYSIKYLLAILNSKLSKFIVKNTTSNIAITQSLLKKFPIYKIDFSSKKEKQKHDELIKLADKILKFNKDLQKLNPLLDEEEYKELKSEIDKTDREIDVEVYRLYGLTKEEIKIVEGDK